jgi:hypothetical protein
MGPTATYQGTGQPGSGGSVPRIEAFSPPRIGNAEYRVAVTDALGGAPALLALRDQAPGPGGGIVVGGITQRKPTRVASRTQLAGAGAGQGFGTWTGEIPFDPALVGTNFWMQWLVRDPGAAGGVARSPWAEVTIF